MKLVYATRKSALALAQSRAFIKQLVQRYPHVEPEELQIVTTGDTIQHIPLFEVGGKGLFVKEIEQALVDGRAHIAVHSMKDVPNAIPNGLCMASHPVREDPRDAFVSKRFASLASLPSGARVGSSSLRRMTLVRALRPDLDLIPLRGNVDTRLRKLDAGEFDGILLAAAGLRRLGLEKRIAEALDPAQFIPAVAQGALGIECRQGDDATRELLAGIHDESTAIAVATERGVLEALEGDCKTPLGAFAQQEGEMMRLIAFVASHDGTRLHRREIAFPWPDPDLARARGLEVGLVLAADRNSSLE